MERKTSERDRLSRAKDIDADDLSLLGDRVEVESQSDPEKSYIVDFSDPLDPSCECPDYVYRGTTCKHMARAADELSIIEL